MIFIGPISPFGHKTKPLKPTAIDVPTSNIGTPIPVIFGTRIIKEPFIAWYGDVSIHKTKVDSQGKK